MRIFRFAAPWAALAVVLLFAAPGRAQIGTQAHAKITLISEENALAPGKTAWIGVLFQMDPGWHIYWQNPGDSGEPPKPMWQLPAGFRAGEIRWPVPVRLGSGTVIDYGYEGRVLLPVPLAVPADYGAGAPATISADVRYLICREVCIPAKAQVSLTIPEAKLSTADAAANRELFRATREQWPKRLPAGAKAGASDAGKNFVLTVDTGKSEAKAAFFPLDEDQIDNSAPQAASATATGVRFTLKKSDQLLKPIRVLRGVVVFGPGQAYEISAPVTAKK